MSRVYRPWPCTDVVGQPGLMVSAASRTSAPAAAGPGLVDLGRGRLGRGGRRRPHGGSHFGSPDRRTSGGRSWHCRRGIADPARPRAPSSRTRARAGGPFRPVGLHARPGSRADGHLTMCRPAQPWYAANGRARRGGRRSSRPQPTGEARMDEVWPSHEGRAIHGRVTRWPTLLRLPLCNARARRRWISGRRRCEGGAGGASRRVASVCAGLGCWGERVDGRWADGGGDGSLVIGWGWGGW